MASPTRLRCWSAIAQMLGIEIAICQSVHGQVVLKAEDSWKGQSYWPRPFHFTTHDHQTSDRRTA
jgi:hypothetical protein